MVIDLELRHIIGCGIIVFLIGTIAGIIMERHRRPIEYIDQRIGEFINSRVTYRHLFNFEMAVQFVLLGMTTVLFLLALVGVAVINVYVPNQQYLYGWLAGILWVWIGIIVLWIIVMVISLYVGKGKCRTIRRKKDETL
jgi:hypothetical protein